MASSALRRSLPRGPSLRSALSSRRPPAASDFCRSFQSGDGETGETVDEFEAQLFGNKGMDEGSLYQELDRAGNASKRYGMGSGSRGGFGGLGDRSSSGTRGGFGGLGDRSSSGAMGGFGGFGDRNNTGSMGGFGGFGDRSNSGSLGGFDSLNDGMSEALGEVARNSQMDDDDDDEEEEDWDDEDFSSGLTWTSGKVQPILFGTLTLKDLQQQRTLPDHSLKQLHQKF
ncbi:hypothetical protein PVAP13_9NG254673 [Panicum virgatum]|uniref:Uncharacterized protein n=1 Tax=Panicum virgatum TaxID=38727 RepID=A0A8T0MKB3_PANVG|nr:hypothetical protein PVAP13_9NG254673 [Panicum virgatum]